MHLESIAAFALAMFVLAASPGPGVFAVTARSMTAGFPRACAMIAGMVLGDLLFLLAAVFGLAALAQTLNWLFTLVKYAGAAYLVYLGLRFIFSRPAPAADGAPRSAPRHSARTRDGFAASFASGLAVTLGNPKGHRLLPRPPADLHESRGHDRRGRHRGLRRGGLGPRLGAGRVRLAGGPGGPHVHQPGSRDPHEPGGGRGHGRHGRNPGRQGVAKSKPFDTLPATCLTGTRAIPIWGVDNTSFRTIIHKYLLCVFYSLYNTANPGVAAFRASTHQATTKLRHSLYTMRSMKYTSRHNGFPTLNVPTMEQRMSFANIDVDDIFIINEYNMIYHLASGISARCNLRAWKTNPCASWWPLARNRNRRWKRA